MSTVEFFIPRFTRFIFVSDFFVSDLTGGAELTTEAIIESRPSDLPRNSIFRLHSRSLTPELLFSNRDKHWIFCNVTEPTVQYLFPMIYLGEFGDLTYSVIEYDFKCCRWRSAFLCGKKNGTGKCNCDYSHVLGLYSNAKNIFWMSRKQKEYYDLNVFSGHRVKGSQTVLSSVFSSDTLKFLSDLRTSSAKPPGSLAMLAGGSWIKGTAQTEEYCRVHGLNPVRIGSPDYHTFLRELSSYESFIFMPLGADTCPRSVIEAKLLGCKTILNDNVLHKDEFWFLQRVEDTERYLSTNGQRFWDQVLKIS